MGFEDAVAYLDALGIDAMKSLRPNTARIEALCELLDHPERSVPAIHITGTNGKTSTARIASSVLAATGLSVATYTSPHLQDVRERLCLLGEPISPHDFGEVFDQLFPYVEVVERDLGQRLTYFEILTLMFFSWAADVANALVVEVGLGGRWDATNVVPASVAVVTNVGLDHTALLGTDRRTIAGEKSGIIKPGAVAVIAEPSPEVRDLLVERAGEAGAETSLVERDFAILKNALAVGGRYLAARTSRRAYEGLFLPLHGAHQGVNATTALEAVTRFIPAQALDEEVVARGLAAVTVPGRLETLPREDAPTVVLDVAHNPDGMSALVNSLLEAFTFDEITFVVGILHDKDYRGMLMEVARLPGRLFITAARSVRSVPVEELRATAESLGLECESVDDVGKAVEVALAATGSRDIVCITGSHYVVGEARTHLQGRVLKDSPESGRL